MNSLERTLISFSSHLLENHPSLYATPKIRLGEQTSIKFRGDFEHSPLTRNLKESFFKSMALEHELPEWIVSMKGMSGRKFRYLLNNLVRIVASPSYLEVGSWAGSTACSALYNNSLNILCIDDWSQFGGPKDQFLVNTSQANTRCNSIGFIEKDFRKVDFAAIGQFNIYFFDGPHGEADQYDGILYALPALTNPFILIVDDFNWEPVRAGTKRVFDTGYLSEIACIEVITVQDGEEPKFNWENSDWHNGYYIAVCEKTT